MCVRERQRESERDRERQRERCAACDPSSCEDCGYILLLVEVVRVLWVCRWGFVRFPVPAALDLLYMMTLERTCPAGDATCSLEDSVIEWSSNVGVLAHVGRSEATVSNCTLRRNFIASGVDDGATLSLC